MDTRPGERTGSVLIVILNWNGASRTIEAADHALHQVYKNCSVLIIDNGSTDDSQERLSEALPSRCRLLHLEDNCGFGGGMNVGLREAVAGGFEYAWLLNNDAFAAPDCLAALVRYMEDHPEVVLATPRLVGPNGVEDHAGGWVDWAYGEVTLRSAAELAGPSAWGKWLTGTALLVRLAGMEKVGDFDPRFFAYYEDVDLCARVLRSGGDIRAVPAATCVHLGGSSSGGVDSPFALFLDMRNSWLFLRKHTSLLSRPAAFCRFMGHCLEKAAVLQNRGRDRHARVVLGALAATLWRRYGRPGRLEGSWLVSRILLTRPGLAARLGRAIFAVGKRLWFKKPSSPPAALKVASEPVPVVEWAVLGQGGEPEKADVKRQIGSGNVVKIGVYLDTGANGEALGGTEYCAALLAEELSRHHAVELVHHRPRFDPEEFAKRFGIDLSAVTPRHVPRQPAPFGVSRRPWRLARSFRSWHADLSQPYDFFLAFIHLIPPHCHAPDGMFQVLFPFFDRNKAWPWTEDNPANAPSLRTRLGRYIAERAWRRRLNSYPRQTVICGFTAHWTRLRWGIETEIHYPPATKDFEPAAKTNTILSVGRINRCKNQLELVDAFELIESDLAAGGWQFYCVGGADEEGEGRLYYESLRRMAEGHAVRVIPNIERYHLKRLYQEAKIFWHGCGYAYEEERYPELMEHFGIVTVEAMAAGCVPVVINRGGQPEIVEHGVSGFLWNSLEELRGFTRLLARDEALREQMAKAAQARAQQFGKKQYIERFYELVPQLRR